MTITVRDQTTPDGIAQAAKMLCLIDLTKEKIQQLQMSFNFYGITSLIEINPGLLKASGVFTDSEIARYTCFRNSIYTMYQVQPFRALAALSTLDLKEAKRLTAYGRSVDALVNTTRKCEVDTIEFEWFYSTSQETKLTLISLNSKLMAVINQIHEEYSIARKHIN